MLRVCLGVCVLLYAWSASAATITAASCQQPAVQAAVDSAVDGDTVTVPAGNCTWASHVGVVDKNVAIIGAGQGATVITRSGGDNQFTFYAAISQPGKGGFRISGMTLTGNNIQTVILVTSQSLFTIPTNRWRVDHITFDFKTGQRDGIGVFGVNYGVIDHNVFLWNDGIAIRQAAGMSTECGGGGSTLSGDFQVKQPLDLGTNNFLFVEDNTFTATAHIMEAYDASAGGGRLVFRYNTVSGGQIYNHWTRGCELANQVAEVYGNTWIATAAFGTTGGDQYMRWEAGTGVIWGNVFAGNWSAGNGAYAMFDERRGAMSQTSAPLNGCDGHQPWDGNAGDSTAPGWPCLGQIGTGSVDATGYANAWDALNHGVKQARVPVYLWRNGYQPACATGGACTDASLIWGDPASYVKAGRDYVLNGNTPKPGYSSFVYPHPLVSGSPTPVPPDPTPIPPTPLPVPPIVPLAPVVITSTLKCAVTAVKPDSTSGWQAQFRQNGVNLGSVDKSSPYTRTVEVTPGTVYKWDVVWTKSGWLVAQGIQSAAVQTSGCQR